MVTAAGSKARRNRVGQGDDPNQARILNLRIPVRESITVVAAGAGVGFGFAILDAAGLPPGDFVVLGGVAWLRFEEFPLSANIIDAWNGDFSLGTSGTADVTLSGNEVNILASTPIGPATTGVIARARYAIPAVAASVNNNTPGGLNLNLLIDAADITDATSPIVLVTGMIALALAPLGKNA
jgi:hypothetical protein